MELAKASADTAAAAETTRRDELMKTYTQRLDKLQLTHEEVAQRTQADAAKSHNTISQLNVELEKMRAAMGAEIAAKAEETRKWEAEAAQAQGTISKLQTELELAKVSADTAAAAMATKQDELEKLRLAQEKVAQTTQADAAKSHDTMSQQKVELEKLRAAALSETAAKAEETQKLEAAMAQAQDTISKLQTHLKTAEQQQHTAAAAARARGSDVEKLRLAQEEIAQRIQADAAKLQGTISQPKVEPKVELEF